MSIPQTHDEFINTLKTSTHVQFSEQAVSLVAEIAKTCSHDQLIHILRKAFGYRPEDQHRTHRRELEKLRYDLQRALAEYNQIVKDNIGNTSTAMESHLEVELREAYTDLVEFMNRTMDIKHDDFVSVVHESDRLKNYALILNKLDDESFCQFKQNQVLGCHEIAKIASDITKTPASWFLFRNWEMRCLRIGNRLRNRVFGASEAIGSIVEVLHGREKRKGSPLGAFLFQGSNWVTKSVLIKTIAEELYDNRAVEIDMTRYADEESILSLMESIKKPTKLCSSSVVVFCNVEMIDPCLMEKLCTLIRCPGNGLDDSLVILKSGEDDDEMDGWIRLVDGGVKISWPSDVKDCSRVLMREWGERNGVIVCPTRSALMEMQRNCGSVKGLQRWMDENVFAMMIGVESKGLPSKTICLDKEEESGCLYYV